MTVQVCPSYVCGSWHRPEPSPEALEVRDPSTSEVVSLVSAAGVDLARTMDYARTSGRSNLQDLTIHQRALIIKKLALYLQDHKEMLYRESFKTGATHRDNAIDIDGGIATLFSISSKARRELPNATVVVDGPTEVLSRDGSFLGTHVYTSAPGIAVFINAFNFPVWGLLEKFAPAFIAGVPAVVKPAPQSAFVTAAVVELMVDSGLLPEGSLSLVSGGAVDVLEPLDYRDHIAFTGSAATAALLAQHPAVAERGAVFSAEADSLNAAILGPDVAAEDPEYQAFIKSVFNEIVAKAGQKCTAIRRVLVPHQAVDSVAAALAQRLDEKVRLGDPRAASTTMGPLISVEQCQAVSASVSQLIAAGAAVVTGGPQRAEGAFFPPTVLAVHGPCPDAVNSIEAFGPVATVIGYRDIQEAVALACAGRGSLVATVVTHDSTVARTVGLGIAAHHGRVHFLDRDDAATSTGHGSPLPQLIHGGPGRAGGGEELGGVRGIKNFMQRSAIQGSPDHLTALTGQWHRGAAVNRVTAQEVAAGTKVHPFQKDLSALAIGDQFVSEYRTVTLEDITAFAEETGDKFYAHTDEAAAMANPFFPRRVAHGYLLVSWAAGLFVEPNPGPVLANYGLENLRFLVPVTYGDSIRVELTARRITPRVTDDYGEVAWDTVIFNQRDEIVATYEVLTLVEKSRASNL